MHTRIFVLAVTFESRDRAASRPESGIAVTKILSVTELQSDRILRDVRDFLLEKLKTQKKFPGASRRKVNSRDKNNKRDRAARGPETLIAVMSRLKKKRVVQ